MKKFNMGFKIFRVVFVLSVVLTMFSSYGFGAESPKESTTSMKIGYVDVKKVFDSCTATQLATASLKKEIDLKQEMLAKEEAEITKLQKELQDKAVVLSESEKQKRQKEIDDRITSLQKSAEIAQKELMVIEKELTNSIVKSIQDVIVDIAKKEGFKLILEKDSILYGENIVDLTDRVIEKLNKE